MGGLTIMLGVFINLLYTYTLPISHYSTTYMLLYPHLMAKHCLNVSRKSRFLPGSGKNLANIWGCKSMVEGLTIIVLECYWPSYTSNQYQTSTFQQPTCCCPPTLMAKFFIFRTGIFLVSLEIFFTPLKS